MLADFQVSIKFNKLLEMYLLIGVDLIKSTL